MLHIRVSDVIVSKVKITTKLKLELRRNIIRLSS